MLITLTISDALAGKFNNYDLQKIPNIWFSILSLSPVEYEYENHFFLSRPDFPKFFHKGLKVNKTGCLLAVFMLETSEKSWNSHHSPAEGVK